MDAALTPADEQATEPLPAIEVERRRQRRINFLVLPLVLVLAAGVPTLAILAFVQHQQIAGLSTALTRQRQQAVQSGQTPVARPPDAVRSDPDRPTISPAPAPVAGATGARGPGPSDGQVQAGVLAAIRAHPEWVTAGIDPAVLSAYVTNWLVKHPPAPGPPGPPPSAAQLADAVLAVYTAHPPASGPTGPAGPTGPDGKDGADGRPGADATPAQIAAAVGDYVDAHPLPVCADGTEAQAHAVVVNDDGDPLTVDTVTAVICVRTG